MPTGWRLLPFTGEVGGEADGGSGRLHPVQPHLLHRLSAVPLPRDCVAGEDRRLQVSMLERCSKYWENGAAEEDDEPGRDAEGQGHQGEGGEGEVPGAGDGAGGDRGDECRPKQTDDGGIGAIESATQAGDRFEPCPPGQRADEQQEARQINGDEDEETPNRPVRRGI